MTIRNKVAAGSAMLAVVATSLAGFSTVSAQSGSSGDSLAEKIASKFNLNQDEVKAVFDDDRAAHEAERQSQITERLEKAVDKGEITAEQKTKIEAKMKELQDAREAERASLESWATDNKIDMKYVMFGHGRGGDDDRLQQAVDDGDITVDQKKLIEQKQQELQDARDAIKDELDQWAEDNDIDQKYLMFGGHGMGGGHGGPDGGRF
jgi:hypothetical protein